MAILLTLVFFDDDYLLKNAKRCIRWVQKALNEFGLSPAEIEKESYDQRFATNSSQNEKTGFTFDQKVAFWVVVYILFQSLIPLKRYLFENSLWIRQGHYFTWTMKLASYTKRDLIAVVKDSQSNRQVIVNHAQFITFHQYKNIATNPRLILNYAHALESHYEKKGLKDPKVYIVKSVVGLNSFPAQNLIDPKIDLTKETYHYFKPNKWVLTLKKELHAQTKK